MRRAGVLAALCFMMIPAAACARPRNTGAARVGSGVEAVRLISTQSGVVDAIKVIVPAGNSARSALAGLYSDRGGKPARLITSGAASVGPLSGWVTVHVRPATVRSGHAYWIAIAGKPVALRLTPGRSSCSSESSVLASVNTLPPRWHSGRRSARCLMIASLAGGASASSPSADGSAASGGSGPGSAGAGLRRRPVLATPPVIDGSAVEGQSLTAGRGSWRDDPTTFSYQWQDCSAARCSVISGATANSLTLRAADVGDSVDVVVTASNAVGSSAATSGKTAVVTATAAATPTAPADITAPGISGAARQGQMLAASAGSWSGSPSAYGYQWRDCSGSSCSNISGATGSSYTLGVSDVGHSLDVLVTASNSGGSVTANSASTAQVLPAAPLSTAPPAITGNPQQGQSLSASPGSWNGSPASYAYQWQDCSGSSCSDIAGATGSSYTLVSTDVGDSIVVEITASNAGGNASATSGATAVVTAPSGPGTGGSGPLDGIKVAGNQLETGSGQPVVLHGVDQSGTEYECTQGYGIFDNGASSLAASASDSSALAVMPSWGINSVFIGLNEDCWLGINGSGVANWSVDSGQNYIAAIKAAVAGAEADGLYPVIGFYWGDPGTEVPSGNDPNGGGQPPLPDADHAPLFWEEVADTFKNDPNVIFRLQEEPHPANVSTALSAWQCWNAGDVQFSTSSVNGYGIAPTPASSAAHCSEKATNGTTSYATVGMQSLVNIIRGAGAGNVIQVPGLAYANMTACSSSGNPVSCGILDSTDGVKITDPTSTSAPQLMVDLDMYPDGGQICDTVTCYQDTIAPVMAVMPVDLGEIGPVNGSQSGALTLLNWMDSRSPQGSYYAWAWNTWSALLSSYSGTPSSPWGTDYKGLISATAAPSNTTAPSITGELQQGAAATATDGTWTQGGIAAYQWQNCTSPAGGCTDISGATGQSYTPSPADVGDYLAVTVTYTNTDGSSTATSPEAGPVQALAQPTDGITFDQVLASSSSSCDPTSAMFTLSHVSAGDDLFLIADGVGYTGAASTVTSVSDTKDGLWTPIVRSGSQQGNVGGDYASYSVFEYSGSAAATSSSPTAVTVSSSWGQSGVSCVILAVKGVASFSEAFDTSIQNAANVFSGPTLSSVPSGDVVMGLFGSYGHSTDVFAAPTGWNTSSSYWDVSQGTASMDWTQAASTAPLAASIDLNSSEVYYGMSVDLHP
jgi:cellulase (glycosyl hydrolase family 5)